MKELPHVEMAHAHDRFIFTDRGCVEVVENPFPTLDTKEKVSLQQGVCSKIQDARRNAELLVFVFNYCIKNSSK